MIEGIQSGSALARAALEAAQRTQQAAARVDSALADGAGAAPTSASFDGQLSDAVRGAVRAVDAELQSAQRLPVDLLSGEMTDFHSVAAQIKRTELTFKFALEVRNKLIEAYRETMRMSV